TSVDNGPTTSSSRSRRERRSQESTSRGHLVGVRGPWSLRARRLLFGRSLARRSEPQGPCLPAGPPELLLGLVGQEDAAHVNTLQPDPQICKRQLGCRSESIVGP